ncbi:hypothetical protein OsJ_12699 [Oryza sativa Japonica Group]|uniref:Dof-type domain-containing protein n=1 Tax=Oryza sativa subsp. japonica TaxID=39947 RepID=A3AMZ7_ORYSJ|nr:hypothetical protein OsJ_12699 [Oryza sativa Japonica Group]
MDQLKGASALNHASLPVVLQPIVSNPSPTSSSSTSSRSSAQATQQRSSSATSSPHGQGQGGGAAEQAPLRCPRCNSSNTKFCYYNNYNLTQPRHFCKTCRRYWTKGGALRNVPIGGGCRKPRPMPAPVAKPPMSCKAAPPLGLGGGPVSWASGQQAATAHLMALLNSARGVQGHGGSNVHRLLGLDTMGSPPDPARRSQWRRSRHGGVALATVRAAAGHSTAAAMTPSSAWGRWATTTCCRGLGLKLPSSASSSPAASYYSDQLHAVVSNAGRPQAPYDVATASLPCTTAVTSLPSALSSVSAAAPTSNTVGMDLPPVSLAAPEMQYWNGPAAMSVPWPDLPTPNGAFP